jgi:hypothetical protein
MIVMIATKLVEARCRKQFVYNIKKLSYNYINRFDGT